VSPPPAPTGVWQVAVRADATYFEVIKAMGGEDAGSLAFPRFSPERRFQLSGEQMVIGRRSRSRGVTPDIDLTGPPEDPGVSHLHALLVAQPDGWAVVDLESANGTYLNDPSSDALDPNVPYPLKSGDTVYLGAWTALTISS
jgi:pSer/pThr/pTyr-binding forkhead associated (FHA) protein